MSINYTQKQNKRPVGQELYITSEPHVVGVLGVNTPSQSTYFNITQVVDDTHLVVNSTSGMSSGNSILQGSASTLIVTVTDATHLVVTSTLGFYVGVAFLLTTVPTMIKLVEVPRQDTPVSSVMVPGYTETTSPTPGSGQFYVDYVNGYITFNANATGLSVTVSYYGRGSEIDAIDVDELQQAVGTALDIYGTVTPNALIYGIQTATNPSGTLPTQDVDNYTGLIIIATSSVTVTLPSPTNTSEGRFFTALNSSTSTHDVTIDWTNPGTNSLNIAIGSGASWLWDGHVWILIAGGGGGFPVFPSDPATPFLGQTYFNSTNMQFLGYDGSVWVVLG
jgi:hypothetical protein